MGRRRRDDDDADGDAALDATFAALNASTAAYEREAREADRRAKMIVISNRCVELKESVNVVNA